MADNGTPPQVWLWVVGGVGGYFAVRYLWSNYFDDGAPPALPPPVSFDKFKEETGSVIGGAMSAQKGAIIGQVLDRFNSRLGFVPSGRSRYPAGATADTVEMQQDLELNNALVQAAGSVVGRAQAVSAACARAQAHLLNSPYHKDDASSTIWQMYHSLCNAPPSAPAAPTLHDPDETVQGNAYAQAQSAATANDIIAKYRATHPTAAFNTVSGAQSAAVRALQGS